MTFTEAAVEVLRRAGKPLHFKDIATEAVTAGLLSHVGQTPEATMGARLVSMAKREHDRKVVALDTGTFALMEWGLPLPVAVEPVVVEPPVDESQPQYRPRERHPPLQDEVLVAGRREDRRRGRSDEGDGHRKKRYSPPADVAWQWLKERGEPATLAELAQGLREHDRIAEALERDLGSLERALKEENRRRRDGRRPPMFELGEDGRVKALEQPKEAPRERRPEQQQKQPRREEKDVRPAGAEEQRRNVARTVRRRLGSLDGAALERVAVALLEAQGYRELNMARRSAKEGPLYLARRKWGASELRYAIRVLRPGRELGRTDVQDVRRDITRYSAQIGVVLGTAECTREAKSEANAPNQAPIMLYGGEAVAEALVDAGLGAARRLIEWVEYDDEFFTNAGAGEALPDVEGMLPSASDSAEETIPSQRPVDQATQEQPDRDGRGRHPRERRRGRHPREGGRGEPATSAAVPPTQEQPADGAVEAPAMVEATPAEVSATPPEPTSPELVAAPEPPVAAEPAEPSPPST